MSKKKTPLNVDSIHAAAVADEQHSFADEATQSVFGQLAESTVGYKTRENWETGVRVVEDEYMEKVHAKTEGAKTKGTKKKPGRWKYRTYLPTAWSSSKSVCGQAIEQNIKLDADSKKTATELAIKEAKVDGTVKTPREKFRIAMDTAHKVLSSIDEADRHDVLTDFGIDPSKGSFNWTV